MITMPAPNGLASVVLAVEAHLHPDLAPLQARVAALRILLSRLGEEDAMRQWPSKIWRRGALVFSRVFERTWPKQRVLLALAAARAAVTAERNGLNSNATARLFRLEPRFDALVDHALNIVDPSKYEAISSIIDGMDVEKVSDLKSLRELNLEPDASWPDVSLAVQQIVISLSNEK